LEAGKDEYKKALALFGPVRFNTHPVTVTICGVCKNIGKHTAQAGAAAYFWGNSGLNCSARVWGNQTNSRPDLISLLLALQVAPKTKTLHVATRSEYVIKSVKYYAYRNDACGWKCANGDVLMQWIKCRSAPIHFTHIKKGNPTLFYMEVKLEAEKGCNLPRPGNNPPQARIPPPAQSFLPDIHIIPTDKVTADIADDGGDTEHNRVPRHLAYPAGHRGRERLYALRDLNQQKLFDAPTTGVLWNEIRRISDPAPIPISVSADDLKTVFEKRLNPPIALPALFDAPQHKMNRLLADLIPEKPQIQPQRASSLRNRQGRTLPG
jgi:ribonuclease HI